MCYRAHSLQYWNSYQEKTGHTYMLNTSGAIIDACLAPYGTCNLLLNKEASLTFYDLSQR